MACQNKNELQFSSVSRNFGTISRTTFRTISRTMTMVFRKQTKAVSQISAVIILVCSACIFLTVYYSNRTSLTQVAQVIQDVPTQLSYNNCSSGQESGSILEDEAVAGIPMDDPRLIEAVRKLLVPPSSKPTRFTKSKYLKHGFNPSAGQVQLIESILEGLGHDGFFIECGANDGEWHSNTIWTERTLGWKGLLIEADPPAYKKLLNTHRNAWSAPLCLSNTNFAQKLTFYRNGGVMGSLQEDRKTHKLAPVTVQCVPLYTILLAINRTTVDFFSLDIEGNELDVLRTVPFDKVTFKVVTIEYILIKEGKEALKEFMASKGYVFYKSFQHPENLAGDFIFLHSSIETSKRKK